jgi:hypothetical protein
MGQVHPIEPCSLGFFGPTTNPVRAAQILDSAANRTTSVRDPTSNFQLKTENFQLKTENRKQKTEN